jgi:N-acetylglucosamine transport system substrate-binding protein
MQPSSHDHDARAVSRRRFLEHAATLLGLPAALSLAAACAPTAPAAPTAAPTQPASPTAQPKPAATTPPPATSAPPATAAAVKPTAPATAPAAVANPLTVVADQPLEVVIFKGGYGDDYGLNAEKIYQRTYPGAKITHQGLQRLQEQLQPRFVGGNPPDVIDNSGGGNLDTAALVAESQLADLADLLAAPAFDTPGKTFKDTLLPGSQAGGIFDGKQYVLKYAAFIFGLWYSDSLFKKQGWEYPKTWDKMLALCDDIKKAGMSGWAYEGKNPYYVTQIFNQMVWKHGGMQVYVNLDNLEPNAWKQPAVQDVAEALYMLADRGHFLPGTEGLTNTESQTEWLRGKAVFVPVGSWLENEMKGSIPDGFNMKVQPTPSLSGDKIAFEGVQSGAGEDFIVPAKGKNAQGGKELLRMLFSKEGARFFAENTRSHTVVLNSADGLQLGTAFESVLSVVAAAGANVLDPLGGYVNWYNKLTTEVNNQMAQLLAKRSKPAEFLDNVQKMDDDIARDPSIKKYQRTA